MEEYIDSLFGDSEHRREQPTRTETVRCALIGAPLCSGTSGGMGKTRAITDQGETPLGADLERAVSDLGAELAITPQERSRARRKVFDREVEPIGAPHCQGTDYPNPKDRARPSHIIDDNLVAPIGASNLSMRAGGLVNSGSMVDKARGHCHEASSEGTVVSSRPGRPQLVNSARERCREASSEGRVLCSRASRPVPVGVTNLTDLALTGRISSSYQSQSDLGGRSGRADSSESSHKV